MLNLAETRRLFQFRLLVFSITCVSCLRPCGRRLVMGEPDLVILHLLILCFCFVSITFDFAGQSGGCRIDFVSQVSVYQSQIYFLHKGFKLYWNIRVRGKHTGVMRHVRGLTCSGVCTVKTSKLQKWRINLDLSYIANNCFLSFFYFWILSEFVKRELLFLNRLLWNMWHVKNLEIW